MTVASIAWAMDADNPLAAGGVAAGVTFGVSWLLALAWWRDRVASRSAQESPQPIAEVVYPAESLRVELSQDNGRIVDFLDLPFDRDLIVRAAAYLRERDYDTSGMGGASKPLTRSQAEAIRDWMIGNDLAAWVNPNAHVVGWGILPAGRSVLRRLHHYGISTGMIDPPSPKRPVITEADIYARMKAHTSLQTTYQALPGKGLPAFPAGLVVLDQDADLNQDDPESLLEDLWR